jgi:glutamate racemase
MKKNNPIGIFDSGFGGLTVMKEIVRLLPSEDIFYFGDTAHVPYGNKSPKTIQKFTKASSQFLLEKEIKLLVIACNTACALALDSIKSFLPIPVIGVIEPGVEKILKTTRNNQVGIVATRATTDSGVYPNLIQKRNSLVQVQSLATPLLVPLIEEGWAEKSITEEVVKEYLHDFKNLSIDTLLLACTHYPLLQPLFEKNLPGVTVLNSADIVAEKVFLEMQKQDLLKPSSQKGLYRYFVSDDKEKFYTFGKHFLPFPLENVEEIEEKKRDEIFVETCLNI